MNSSSSDIKNMSVVELGLFLHNKGIPDEYCEVFKSRLFIIGGIRVLPKVAKGGGPPLISLMWSKECLECLHIKFFLNYLPSF